jgi:D-lactate dehydrogenase
MDRDATIRGLTNAVRGPVHAAPEAIERYSRDASHLSCRPLAAVQPLDPDDVVALVGWARRSRTPLVPRGAGSSLDGESVPVPGSVVVDMSGWNAILGVDPEDRTARVGPGLVNLELHRALRPYGLFFPPNPGSWTVSTLGGNVATNASGPRSYRYGPTRAWVRGLELVLGTGERLRCGRPVRKRSVGPELAGLFVGSEGTLGIFTELTLGLAPAPERRVGLVLRLADPGSVSAAATTLRAGGDLRLSSLELLDARCTTELARLSSGRIAPGAPTLLVEVETTQAQEGVLLERFLEVSRGLGLREEPGVYPDADELWTLRGRSSEALDRAFGPRVREDVAVPVSRLSELLALVERLARERGVEAFVYGHIGEASLHPNFGAAPGSALGEQLRHELLDGVLALGGTISSEHGIGLVKRAWVEAELGPVATSLLSAWKRACDPDGILNPGKLYPVDSGASPPPVPSPSGPEAGRTPTR